MAEAPLLHLLKAEDLPKTRSAIRADMTADLASLMAAQPGADPAAVRSALRSLGPPDPPTAYTAADRAALPDDRYEEHDRYFRAVRVASARPLHAFVRTLVEAYEHYLDDVHTARTHLTIAERCALADGFRAVFAFLGGDDQAPATPPGGVRLPQPCAKVQPLLRWKLGHQVFFVQIQGLVVLLDCLADTLTGDDPGATGILELATVAMRGSGAALRYAGDFSPEAYAGEVRPAMMPPHLQPRFSGLQVRDHRVLMEAMVRVKPALLAGPEPVREAHGRFVAAMADTYDAHKYVCSRFDGDREPSLRMSAGNKTSAVEVLERFKQQRRRRAAGD